MAIEGDRGHSGVQLMCHGPNEKYKIQNTSSMCLGTYLVTRSEDVLDLAVIGPCRKWEGGLGRGLSK